MASKNRIFTKFSNAVSRAAGRPMTFIICCLAVIGWAASGPLFGFSDTWQLVINTSTTIVTFLMVFLIQNTQNRDNAAMQAKLDEIIRASDSRNRLIGLEHGTEEEIAQMLEEIEDQAKDAHAERRDAAREAKKAEATARKASAAKKRQPAK